MKSPAEATREDIEAVVKDWREARSTRLELSKKLKPLEEKEKELKNWLIAACLEQNVEGVIVDGRSTGPSTKNIMIVEDPKKLKDYILANDALDLLQLRLSSEAVKSRQENGEVIPGIGEMPVYDLYDRKS